MNTLTVKELQVIAKAEGIALSYTVDGKRHKLNKAELIEAIEAKQAEKVQSVEQVETSDTQAVTSNKRTVTTNLIIAKPYKSNAIVVSGENIKLNRKSNADQDLNLNTVVKDSKRLLQIGLVDKVKSYISILNNKIRDEKRNKLLINHMSVIRNILVSLIIQHNKKVAEHA